jgi:hypothetical protein
MSDKYTPIPTDCSLRFVNAADFGFSPEASGIENAKALQSAVDQGGTIAVTRTGTYELGATVYVGSNTTLHFGNGVFLKKVKDTGEFCHVFLNKGALTREYDHNIVVSGLHIIVNGVDCRKYDVFGLHGQLAFFYTKDIRIDRFRCLDLGALQYGIHVCTFEDLIIDDVVIKGDKDGVHLGRGKRFVIRNGVFQTYDDAVALNAHDYSTGNPELGWIEDGVVEMCHDLNAEKTTGFFCRILAGGWIDWRSGMEVQQSDSVVSDGRLYRVQAKPDGTLYKSTTQPTHRKGSKVLDGINWGVVQNHVTYTAGVRNVVFRDIFLNKPRIAFSVHFDNDKYSRSYYPGAAIPVQKQLSFDNIRINHDQPKALLSIGTPVDVVRITGSSIKNNPIRFHANRVMPDYKVTQISMLGCIFCYEGPMDLVTNSVDGKIIVLKTYASTEIHDGFSAKICSGNGRITLESDLTGLAQNATNRFGQQSVAR